MKASEEYKWDARKALIAGTIGTVLLLAMLIISLAKIGIVEVLISLSVICFVVVLSVSEYWSYKSEQKEFEKQEAREETERQQLMSANQK